MLDGTRLPADLSLSVADAPAPRPHQYRSHPSTAHVAARATAVGMAVWCVGLGVTFGMITLII